MTSCPECGRPSPERRPGARGRPPVYHRECRAAKDRRDHREGARIRYRRSHPHREPRGYSIPGPLGGNPGGIPNYASILARDPCSYCGGQGGEIEHIEPRASGGTNEWENLTSACRSCNSRKWTYTLLGALLLMSVEREIAPLAAERDRIAVLR